MIDLVLLIYLTIKIGRVATEKGYPGIAFQFMLVSLWLGGELVGGGIAAFASGKPDMCSLSLGAFLGGLLAQGFGFLLVAVLPTPKQPRGYEDYYRDARDGKLDTRSRRRRARDEEDEDDRPRRRSRRDEEEDDRPRRRPRYEDDDDDDRDRRRRSDDRYRE